MPKSKSKKPATAQNKRLPTVFDYSALRLHPDGRRVQQRDSRRINDIDHVPNTVLSRTGWIAADAGGKLGGYKRVKARVEEEGEVFDLGDDKEEGGDGEGEGEGRKGKEREENEEEERPRKKRKKDVRTERRREFLDDWSFLDGLETIFQSQPSSRGLSRHVTPGPGQLNPTQDVLLPLPSSGLLKCIHHFASSYYTERGQMLQISRQYRKEKKERRMKTLELAPAKSPKSKSRGSEREDDSLSRGSSPSTSDSEDEEADPPANEDAKPKRKPAKTYRDMYKMFDGTALMAIGMLIQSHVDSLLKPNVPEHWERDVRLTWGAPPLPRAEGVLSTSTAESAHGAETSNQTEWEQTVQKDRLRREKAREYDDNEFYRTMLEGVDEYVDVRWRKIKTRKKVVEESDEEESGDGEEEGEGEGEGEREGGRGEGDGDGEQEGEAQKGTKGKGKAKASPLNKGKKKMDTSPRKGGRKSKVVFKSAEIIESSDEGEWGGGGASEAAAAPAIADTITAGATTAAQVDESSEEDGTGDGGVSASASALAGASTAAVTEAEQAVPNTADNDPNSASASRPRGGNSQPDQISTPSMGSTPTSPLPPTTSCTAPVSTAVPIAQLPADISPAEGSASTTSRPSVGPVSSSLAAEKRKRKRKDKDKEAGTSRSVTQPLASSPSPSSPIAGLQVEGAAPTSRAASVPADIVPVEGSASRPSVGPVSRSAVEKRKRKSKDKKAGTLGSAIQPLSSTSSSTPHAEGTARIPSSNIHIAEQAAASTPLPSSSKFSTTTAPAQTQSSLASRNSVTPSATGILSSTSGLVSAMLIQAEIAETASAPRKKRKLASTPAEGSTALPSSSSASPALPAAGSSGAWKQKVASAGSSTAPASSRALPPSAGSSSARNTTRRKAAEPLTTPSSAASAGSTVPAQSTLVGVDSVPRLNPVAGAGASSPTEKAETVSGTRRKRKVASAAAEGSTPAPVSSRSSATPVPLPSTSTSSHALTSSTGSKSVRNTRKQKATGSATSRPASTSIAEVGDASAPNSVTMTASEEVLEETQSAPASAGSKGKKRKAPSVTVADSVNADGDRPRKKKHKSAPVPESKEGVSQGGLGGAGDARDVEGEEAASIPQASGSTPADDPSAGGNSQGEARQAHVGDTAIAETGNERRGLRARKTIKYTR